MKSFLLCIPFFLFVVSLPAQEISQDSILKIIRKHGMAQSEVGEIASWIVDVHGPRMTGSPGLDKATAWATQTLGDWGMTNVHLEEWGPFGRGWELEHFELHAESGSYWTVLAHPKAWSSSSSGTGEVIYLDIHNADDLAQYEGKLAGKFVLMDTIRAVEVWFTPLAKRLEAEDLLDLANKDLPTPRPRRDWSRRSGGFNLSMEIWKLLEREKPLAVLDRSYKGDLGTIFVQGARASTGNVRNDTTYVVPQVTLSVEHYNRILRMLNKGITTTLTIDLKTRYTNADGMEHNIIAEIPGTDLAHEVVMFGAHFDTWHAAGGATDNGAGSSVMMEVARILLATIKDTGIRPRRTLRLALWTGEEQGLLGSRHYVGQHYAEFTPDSYTPQSLKPANTELAAYYNLDGGTGKIRGIYLQGNDQVVNLFRKWFAPFEEDGASTVSLGSSGSTDHVPFAGIGIPAFQFIQEPIAYSSRTHHSSMDFWDHLMIDDLKQAATIITSIVWNTAQLDEKLPRKETDLVK